MVAIRDDGFFAVLVLQKEILAELVCQLLEPDVLDFQTSVFFFGLCQAIAEFLELVPGFYHGFGRQESPFISYVGVVAIPPEEGLGLPWH